MSHDTNDAPTETHDAVADTSAASGETHDTVVDTGDASSPLTQLWRALRGRDCVFHKRSVSIPRIREQLSGDVSARLVCFAAGLGVMIVVGLVGTAVLQAASEAPLFVHDLWSAIGAWIGLVVTVAVTRSELRAAALLLIAATLGSTMAFATALPAIVVRSSPGGSHDHGSYFAIGTALGIALAARAVIAYRRSPAVVSPGVRASIRRAAIVAMVIGAGTAVIYWLSQRTPPNDPAGNARFTALLAATAVGITYHFVAPPPPRTSVADVCKRLVLRMAPLATAGVIADLAIPRMTGEHALPRWVDGLLIGCFAGVFVGYIVDLLERPFAGHRRGTALMTLGAVAVVPALRAVAFDHTSISGMLIAQVGAVVGLVLGGSFAWAVVRMPDRDVDEDDEFRLERIRHVVLIAVSSPPGLPSLAYDLEVSSIQHALADGRHKDSFELHLRLATSYEGLREAIETLAPSVVHLIGHGDAERYFFHGPDDLQEPVPIDEIVSPFRNLASPSRVVVVNACGSTALAKALTTDVDYAIGMSDELDDRSACVFAREFYRALANGKGITESYQLGRNAIRARELPDVEVPHEFTRDRRLAEVAIVPIR